MGKLIVNVRYCSKSGELSSRAYSYYADIPLSVGDRVVVPTYKGDGEAVVSEVDVPESRIDERILPVLKTISRKVGDDA